MPRQKSTGSPPRKRPIDRYEHKDKKRVNNPQVGLVTPETDPVTPTHKVYDYVTPVPSVKPKQELDYDPHLDPQLVWAGKKEHSSFEVPTVSLHVHIEYYSMHGKEIHLPEIEQFRPAKEMLTWHNENIFRP